MKYFTSLAAWEVVAPGEVPLTREQLGTHDLVTWITLVGHHGALNQVWVRRTSPAIRHLRELRAGVVTRNFCMNKVRNQDSESLKKTKTNDFTIRENSVSASD